MLLKSCLIVQKNCFSGVFARFCSNRVIPIITCKRKEFNYFGKPYGKNEDIPIASEGWHHKKARGDYFIINRSTRSKQGGIQEDSTFEMTGLSGEVIKAISNFNHPTEIQKLAIPVILSGCNSMVMAETGCGKTLAYLLPILHQIIQWKTFDEELPYNSPSAIIISPNRELVTQIYEVAKVLCEELSLNVKSIIGGHTKRLMVNPSFEQIDLLISSVGALSKLLSTGIYKIDRTHHVVLDEADSLLDDSFFDRVLHVLKRFPFQHRLTLPPKGCQLTMASATIPKDLPEEIFKFIDPTSLKRISTSNLHKILPHVPQRFLRLGKIQKPSELLRIIRGDVGNRVPVMIFSNKSSTCDYVSMLLNENGIKCANLNGNMHVELRNGRFKTFKDGKVDVISCTDIGSRGLDTTRASHILNYDFPLNTADYIHRCGRTGRVGSSNHCRVTNFVSSEGEVNIVQNIERSVRRNVDLPNVDANIRKIISSNIERQINAMERMR